MENKYHIRLKILREKEKLLVTSNCSFSQDVFNSYICHRRVKMWYCVVMG